MADYIKSINNGTMMIRDHGRTVEFWFKTGSTTFNYQQTWGYEANGQYIQRDFRMEKGGSWQRFGSVDTDTPQNVRFRIIGEGLGWPTTDHVAFIDRGTIPPPPVAPTIWDVGANHITAGWGGDGGAGGASITGREIWYSYDGTPRYLISGDGSRQTVFGLVSGGTYYVWARNASSKGWSGFSAPRVVRTQRVPDAPRPPTFQELRQTSVIATFIGGDWDGGSPILEWQIAYGLNGNVPALFRSGYFERITGLSPARRYYFWSRGRNAHGWGPWSARSEIDLLAGAWVKVSGVWRRAIPWVKVAGVWKIAQPNIPINGKWKVPTS